MSVGENLRRSGDLMAAERLINLAGKLLQLERSQNPNNRRKEYFEFLMNLLQQISDRQPTSYSIRFNPKQSRQARSQHD